MGKGTLVGPQSKILEEMNKALTQKENLFQQREAQIEARMEQLQKFELQLIEKATQIKNEKLAFQKEMEEKEAWLSNQEAEIAQRWEEVRVYESNFQDAIAEILTDHMTLKKEENVQLEAELKAETDGLSLSTSARMLEELIAELNGEKEMAEKASEYDISNLFVFYENAAKTVFPDSHVIEITPERFRLSVGKREVRIFAKPVLEVHVLENRKSDKRIASEIVQMNRIQTQWTFVYEENHLYAKMGFKENASAETVLMQCKKVIDEHFK